MSLTSENTLNTDNASICYKGEKKQEWLDAVAALNNLHSTVYPKVIEQNLGGGWKRVHPDFPLLKGLNPNELDPGHMAFGFVEREKMLIYPEKADRDEKSALEVIQSTEKFMKIMVARVKVHGVFETIMSESIEVSAKEFNSSVLLMKVKTKKCSGPEKEDLEDKIIARASDFEESKSKLKASIQLFKDASRCLAEEEGVGFNEKFNKNEYLNYYVFEKKFVISNRKYEEYFQEQEALWSDLLSSLGDDSMTTSTPIKTRSEGPTQKDLEAERNKNEINKLNKKIKLFQAMCEETEKDLNEATLEELQGNLRDIKKLHQELREAMYEENFEITQRVKDYITSKKSLLRKIAERITEIQDKRARDAETRRNEISANIRTMEAVKLIPLTGPEDFIAWKKNQKFLNTHTDPYKKAAALLGTLRNPQDKKMCDCIYDFDKLISILNDKYDHQEKLIPTLKNKLEKLPKALNDEMMLENHRTSLNVYEQLKELGAKSCFDGTVIYNLTQKFTMQAKKDFERFKVMQKRLENVTINDQTFDEDGYGVNTAESKKKPLDLEIIDNSPDHRKYFLHFIREEAKLLEYTKEEGICGKCRKAKAACVCNKSQKPKVQLYNVDATENCPLCQKYLHKNRRGLPTRSVSRCPKFQDMSLKERSNYILKSGSCFMCLTPGHSAEDCWAKGDCYNCRKSRHHRLICPEERQDTNVEVHTCATGKSEETYLKVSQCAVLYRKPQTGISEANRSKYVNVMWDSGASCNLITNRLARELGYEGDSTNLHITTMTEHISGKTPKLIPSKEFNIEILDNDNTVHRIKAFGLEQVQNRRIPIDKRVVQKYAKRFKIPESDIGNPKGAVEMIIGIGHDHLAPRALGTSKYDQDGLRVYSTNFGPSKYVLAGTTSGGSRIADVNNVEVTSQNFWTGDQLGLNTDPKCSTCLKAPACKQCKLLNQPISYKEQEEAKIIKSTMTFDRKGRKITVEYPYLRNVEKIFSPENSNRYIAEKMAKSLFKSLKRDGLLETYTENFLDMENRGAIKELTPEEIEEWESKGNPVNYCSHHGVLKESKSTACRSVCNSSLTHNGTSLNDMLPKGPTAISNLLHVLMRFRARPFVVIADLKKAYNSITTSIKDCHLRRLLWYRKEDLDDPNRQLRTFGMLVMAFGDTPAQYYLECAKEEVANYIRDVMNDHVLSEAIISMSYVDDIALSVETIQEARSHAEKLPVGFGSYGFKIKEIFIGGVGMQQASELENQLLFGHIYNPNEDQIVLKFAVNFSSKKRGQKTQPNLNSLSDLSNLDMTKRKMMSLLSSQYDPLGLASVFLAKYKIFLARLFKVPEYDWDFSLYEEDQKKAKQMVAEMIFAAEHSPSFKRSTKPEGYRLSKLIVFVDASTVALQAVVYGYFTSGSKVHTSLITAKNKISMNTVPRNELQSLVAGHRLVLNVLEALDESVLEICFLSDSTCTLDSLNENFVSKDIYVINRISEIRKAAQKMNCSVKYYHVESQLNIADAGTREDCKFDFLSSKEWQCGPDFIKNVDEVATLHLGIGLDTIPCQINTAMLDTTTTTEENLWEGLLKRSSRLQRVMRVVCIIKTIFRRKSFKGKVKEKKEDMNEAFMFLVKCTQEAVQMKSLRTKQLVTFEENGIIFTKMRFPEHIMKNVFGKDQLPVIPGKSRLAKLVLIEAHQQQVQTNLNHVHNGIQQTLVNSRIGTFGSYITHAKQVIKGIIGLCPVCRRQAKIPSNAKMAERKGGFGEIPMDGSCFNKVAIDYFGPFWCKPPKFKETRGTKFYKIYGMAVLCQQTRAVKFYPVEGYDTKSFLITFEIHCSIHGVPSHVLSDPMTTFISGAKVVGTESENVDTPIEESDFESTLQRKFNIDWEFIPPGSQWRDPAERSIKSLKGMMQTIFNTEHNKTVLTINEYWSIFSQCSEILNRRPIQGYVQDDTINFICPNQLLLGRTSKDAPSYTAEDIGSRPRLELLESLKKEFWKHLMNILAADSRLMKYPCWYSQSRKPKPGDVVLVLYKTKVNDNYRIGVIDTVDENNRDISCFVSPCQDGKLNKFKQSARMNIPIQRTILLHGSDEENQ